MADEIQGQRGRNVGRALGAKLVEWVTGLGTDRAWRLTGTQQPVREYDVLLGAVLEISARLPAGPPEHDGRPGTVARELQRLLAHAELAPGEEQSVPPRDRRIEALGHVKGSLSTLRALGFLTEREHAVWTQRLLELLTAD